MTGWKIITPPISSSPVFTSPSKNWGALKLADSAQRLLSGLASLLPTAPRSCADGSVCACACAGAGSIATDKAPQKLRRRGTGRFGASLLEREDPLPVVLHADDDPALLLRLVVERLREGADLGVGQALARGRRRTRASRRRAARASRAARRRRPWCTRASAGRRSSCRTPRTGRRPIIRWMPSGLPALLSFSSSLGSLVRNGLPSLS